MGIIVPYAQDRKQYTDEGQMQIQWRKRETEKGVRFASSPFSLKNHKSSLYRLIE
jgi:hypothetical protein